MPTHFSLHGYSFDGTIVNQSYYVGHYPNVNGYGSLGLDDGKYGSYAFGIGNHSHLFAANDGDISYIDLADETPLKIDYVNFLPWSDYWDSQLPGRAQDPIPVCNIVPVFNVLQCSLNGTALDFGYCGDHEEGSDYWFIKQVVWGTDIQVTSACKKIVLRAEQVGKDYGHGSPAEYCKNHPGEEGCGDSAKLSVPGKKHRVA